MHLTHVVNEGIRDEVSKVTLEVSATAVEEYLRFSQFLLRQVLYLSFPFLQSGQHILIFRHFIVQQLWVPRRLRQFAGFVEFQV